jgi:hypothetical protein
MLAQGAGVQGRQQGAGEPDFDCAWGKHRHSPVPDIHLPERLSDIVGTNNVLKSKRFPFCSFVGAIFAHDHI